MTLLNTGLPTATPVPFEDATPGSLIEVTGKGINGVMEATVIEFKSEFGPTSVPALVLQPKGSKDSIIITASGDHKIKIKLNAATVGSNTPPEAAVRARKRPLDVIAIQYKGGSGQVGEIIKWMAGHTAVFYRADSDDSGEAIVIRTLEGDMECAPGWWIIQGVAGEFYPCDPDVFAQTYDIIPSVI